MFYNFPLLSFSAKFKICRAKLAIERCRFKIYQNYYAFPAEGPKIWGVTKKQRAIWRSRFLFCYYKIWRMCPGPLFPTALLLCMINHFRQWSVVKKSDSIWKQKTKKKIKLSYLLIWLTLIYELHISQIYFLADSYRFFEPGLCLVWMLILCWLIL